MKTKKSKKVLHWLGVIVVGIALGLTLQFAVAWVGPPGNPPLDNVGAPINTSINNQTKQGKIFLADVCLNGNTSWCLSNRAATSSPTPSPSPTPPPPPCECKPLYLGFPTVPCGSMYTDQASCYPYFDSCAMGNAIYMCINSSWVPSGHDGHSCCWDPGTF